jgi:hypothetical protein
MAAYFVTSIAPGQYFYSTDADPNAVVSAPRGSVALRTDVGNVALYLNTSATTGTVWTEVANTTYDNFQQITLADNLNPALDIGSTGLLNLLRFITTNGAEQVAYNGPVPFLINTGGLQVNAGTVTLPQASLNLPLSTSGMANLGTGAVFEMRIDFPATINNDTNAVLPARAGGFRLTDAHVISGGAGGNVQVQTGGAVTTVANMGLGALGAVSRATNVVPNTVYASGAVVRIRSDAGITAAGTAYIRFEAL